MITVDLPEFDPYNEEHVRAWRRFSETGFWPVEIVDIKERGSESCWVVILQSRLAEAWVAHSLNLSNTS